MSEKSHGNARGVGLADLMTRRLFEKLDSVAINANVLTSTFLEQAKIPMIVENDREVLSAAVCCNRGVPPRETRFVRIPNTLHLKQLYASKNLVDEALRNARAEVAYAPKDLRFEVDGNLQGF